MESGLVERARRGDHDAFARIADEISDRLYAVARRILVDASLAEDALQQALLAIWQGLPELHEASRFEAWAYRVLVRCCYREANRARRWAAEVKSVATVDAARSIELAETGFGDRDLVERGFRRLTPEHRAVLVLEYYVGLDTAEIARALAIPAGTVASRRHYALRTLRSALDADARADLQEAHG